MQDLRTYGIKHLVISFTTGRELRNTILRVYSASKNFIFLVISTQEMSLGISGVHLLKKLES